MFENFDFGIDIIEKYIDFDFKPEISLEKQEFLLKEDILQVIYKNGLILDVGWFPEFNLDGCFTVKIIENYDWENPLKQAKCVDIDVLHSYVASYVDFINTYNR